MLARHPRTMADHSIQLVYETFGDPNKVLVERSQQLPEQLEPKQLRIRWLAASLNPSDMAQITGFYPIPVKPPVVGGNEGVARVEQVGSDVNGLSIGDWVIPLARNLGTWQTQAVVTQNQVAFVSPKHVTKIDNRLPLTTAVQVLVNPPTAYRMLHDFVALQPGDVVLQNGANSAVGKYVIQMCKLLGYKSVNIVRERKDQGEQQKLVDELKALGADLVVTDGIFEKEYVKILKPIGFPKLAFDCVTGPITTAMCLALQQNGKLVNYGAVADSTVQLPAAAAIFRNVSVHGFWLSGAAIHQLGKDKLTEMSVWITSRFLDGSLQAAPVNQVDFGQWRQAVKIAAENSGGKQVLVFPDSPKTAL